MKTLIRNGAMIIAGLLVATAPGSAYTWNKDIHAGWWGGNWIPYASDGANVNAPSGATIGWYAYTYGGFGSYAHVTVVAPGVYVDKSVYDDSSDGGAERPTSAGWVDIYLYTGASGSGGTGCGVTVAW